MRWVTIFDDDERRDSIRKKHSAAHFDLAANPNTIVIAGGLRPAPGVWGKAPCYGTVSL